MVEVAFDIFIDNNGNGTGGGFGTGGGDGGYGRGIGKGLDKTDIAYNTGAGQGSGFVVLYERIFYTL